MSVVCGKISDPKLSRSMWNILFEFHINSKNFASSVTTFLLFSLILS